MTASGMVIDVWGCCGLGWGQLGYIHAQWCHGMDGQWLACTKHHQMFTGEHIINSSVYIAHFRLVVNDPYRRLQNVCNSKQKGKRLTPLLIWKYAVNILNHSEWHQTTSTKGIMLHCCKHSAIFYTLGPEILDNWSQYMYRRLQNVCNSKQKGKRLTPLLIWKYAVNILNHLNGIKPQTLRALCFIVANILQSSVQRFFINLPEASNACVCNPVKNLHGIDEIAHGCIRSFGQDYKKPLY